MFCNSQLCRNFLILVFRYCLRAFLSDLFQCFYVSL
uniref:Uncharacterized protein n=1 Tax=Rhizophora mucronata TaxID=61149 RepID=A0A2P2PQB4_RHIMU